MGLTIGKSSYLTVYLQQLLVFFLLLYSFYISQGDTSKKKMHRIAITFLCDL